MFVDGYRVEHIEKFDELTGYSDILDLIFIDYNGLASYDCNMNDVIEDAEIFSDYWARYEFLMSCPNYVNAFLSGYNLNVNKGYLSDFFRRCVLNYEYDFHILEESYYRNRYNVDSSSFKKDGVELVDGSFVYERYIVDMCQMYNNVLYSQTNGSNMLLLYDMYGASGHTFYNGGAELSVDSLLDLYEGSYVELDKGGSEWDPLERINKINKKDRETSRILSTAATIISKKYGIGIHELSFLSDLKVENLVESICKDVDVWCGDLEYNMEEEYVGGRKFGYMVKFVDNVDIKYRLIEKIFEWWDSSKVKSDLDNVDDFMLDLRKIVFMEIDSCYIDLLELYSGRMEFLDVNELKVDVLSSIEDWKNGGSHFDYYRRVFNYELDSGSLHLEGVLGVKRRFLELFLYDYLVKSKIYKLEDIKEGDDRGLLVYFDVVDSLNNLGFFKILNKECRLRGISSYSDILEFERVVSKYWAFNYVIEETDILLLRSFFDGGIDDDFLMDKADIIRKLASKPPVNKQGLTALGFQSRFLFSVDDMKKLVWASDVDEAKFSRGKSTRFSRLRRSEYRLLKKYLEYKKGCIFFEDYEYKDNINKSWSFDSDHLFMKYGVSNLSKSVGDMYKGIDYNVRGGMAMKNWECQALDHVVSGYFSEDIGMSKYNRGNVALSVSGRDKGILDIMFDPHQNSIKRNFDLVVDRQRNDSYLFSKDFTYNYMFGGENYPQGNFFETQSFYLLGFYSNVALMNSKEFFYFVDNDNWGKVLRNSLRLDFMLLEDLTGSEKKLKELMLRGNNVDEGIAFNKENGGDKYFYDCYLADYWNGKIFMYRMLSDVVFGHDFGVSRLWDLEVYDYFIDIGDDDVIFRDVFRVDFRCVVDLFGKEDLFELSESEMMNSYWHWLVRKLFKKDVLKSSLCNFVFDLYEGNFKDLMYFDSCGFDEYIMMLDEHGKENIGVLDKVIEMTTNLVFLKVGKVHYIMNI